MSSPSLSTGLRLAFAGTPAFAVPALEALAASRHEVLGVFTQPDRKAGRGRVLTPGPVKARALSLGLPVLQPESFRSAQTLRLLDAMHVDVLVVVAYGQILPVEALQLPRLGCINIHASLLPRWRGAAPIQRAILAGDVQTGITIMRMEAGLDTGPMLASAAIDIGVRDTAGSLQATLASLGACLMCEVLEQLEAGTAVGTPQPSQGITHAAKVDKAEAEICWTAPAAEIDRKVRAFNPRPVAQTHWLGQQLRIWQAGVLMAEGVRDEPGRVLAHARAGVDVACGQGVLRIGELQLPGRTRSSAEELLRARSLAGALLGAA